jgi:hypothetical protein
MYLKKYVPAVVGKPWLYNRVRPKAMESLLLLIFELPDICICRCFLFYEPKQTGGRHETKKHYIDDGGIAGPGFYQGIRIKAMHAVSGG